MQNCEQTKGQTLFDHGVSVKNHLFDLINHLRFGDELLYVWRLPDWVMDNKNCILCSLPSDETLMLYTTYHDAGKWACLEVDENGRRHFPNHAEVSYEYFKKVFDNDVAAELILHDMDIHLLKAVGVEEFSKNPHALTLLLTGLAEIHSNSRMFGGMESTSFKIKWKSINQRCKQIIKLIKERNA